MKKRLLTLLMVIFTLPLFAQQGDVVLCEGFFNPWLEEGWDAKGANLMKCRCILTSTLKVRLAW